MATIKKITVGGTTYDLHDTRISGVDTTPTSGSANVVTSGGVYAAIEALPEPMIFKGSLGTGGTITTLPAASSANEGFTYKVITAGTYQSIAAKVGDTFISTGSAWVLIPSGDEPSGTVTSITLKATSPITIDSTAAITTSGTRTLSHATSGVSAGTYKSVTVNSTGHVTAGSNPTTLSGYGITDAKIQDGTITLGSETLDPILTNGEGAAADHIATFESDNVIKDSGFTIGTSVPNGAVFTDANVSQFATTTTNWRKVILGYQANVSEGAAIVSYNGPVYETVSVEVQPSTNTLKAAILRAANNDLYIGSASNSQCHQQYDATNKCLKFIFD